MPPRFCKRAYSVAVARHNPNGGTTDGGRIPLYQEGVVARFVTSCAPGGELNLECQSQAGRGSEDLVQKSAILRGGKKPAPPQLGNRRRMHDCHCRYTAG